MDKVKLKVWMWRVKVIGLPIFCSVFFLMVGLGASYEEPICPVCEQCNNLQEITQTNCQNITSIVNKTIYINQTITKNINCTNQVVVSYIDRIAKLEKDIEVAYNYSMECNYYNYTKKYNDCMNRINKAIDELE